MLLKEIGRSMGKSADMGRATIIDLPVLLTAVGVLYGMAFVDDGWSIGDGIAVVVLATVLMRTGVARRWS